MSETDGDDDLSEELSSEEDDEWLMKHPRVIKLSDLTGSRRKRVLALKAIIHKASGGQSRKLVKILYPGMTDRFRRKTIPCKSGEECIADILNYLAKFKIKKTTAYLDLQLLSLQIMLRVTLYNDRLAKEINPKGVSKAWRLIQKIKELDIEQEKIDYILKYAIPQLSHTTKHR